MDEAELIGKRVKNRKTHSVGKIVDLKGRILTVSFHGELIKYAYPEAFSKALEFEDEEEQVELKKSGLTADFGITRNEYASAINGEISYLRRTGGKRYRLIDGTLISANYQESVYAFDSDTELHFPDGSPIKIYFSDSIISASIISCEEYTVMLRSSQSLGEKVGMIEFTAEQWILLEALRNRLLEISPKDYLAYKVACEGPLQIDEQKPIFCGQDYALRHSTSEDVTFIWGPPGTGKTETLARIALEYIDKGKRVLMLSYSNVSVDGALLRVANMSDEHPGKIIRYGYPRMPEIQESQVLSSYLFVLAQNAQSAAEYQNLIQSRKHLRSKDPKRIEINRKLKALRDYFSVKEKELVQKASFVATTVSKAVIDKAIYEQKFDLVIFDEASMAYVPQIVFASSLAKTNFVCLGDFCQLPPIVQNKEDTRLSKDIFDYVGISEAVETNSGHDWLAMLDVQYRMHPQIADFASKFMYSGRLKTAEKIIENRQGVADCAPLESESMGLIDTSGSYSVCVKTGDESRINILSAFISLRLAELYKDQYEVGIITPYNAQSRLILAMVRDLAENDESYLRITCATVHQFQGSEKPIIIYDAVDCYRMPYPGTLLTSLRNNTANRLFNVALTRAQGKFILVANTDYFRRKKLSNQLMLRHAIEEIRSQNSVISGNGIQTSIGSDNDRSHMLVLSDNETTWSQYLKDLSDAKEEIRIDLPGAVDDDGNIIGKFSLALKNAKKNNVSIQIRTDGNSSLPPSLRGYMQEGEYVTNPITFIDRNIIWYGHPFCNADFITEDGPLVTKYFPCIRFNGIHTSKSIKAFLS